MPEHSPISPHRPEEAEAMLAMATRSEFYKNGEPAVDFSRFTSRELYSIAHHMEDVKSRIPSMASHTDRVPTPQDERLHVYEGAVERAFDQLQDHVAPDVVRDVFTLLAESSSALDRRFAGHWIGTLTRVDREYGLELWKRLLEDDDRRVAAATWDISTHIYIEEGGPEPTLRRMEADNITWDDLTELIETYIRRLETIRDRFDL